MTVSMDKPKQEPKKVEELVTEEPVMDISNKWPKENPNLPEEVKKVKKHHGSK